MAAEIKFLMDDTKCVPLAITRGLQKRKVDVLTAQEAGLDHIADNLIIAFALEHARVIFTHDEDFLALNQKGVAHAGIVYVHQQTSIGVILRGLWLIHDTLTSEEMRGRVEFL